MVGYNTPGVYFEWQDAAQGAIAPARVDIAGFVGIARRGPLHQPTRVESWNQFTSSFGRHTTQGHLAYAVQGFFANGGRTCWVVRVADPLRARPAQLDIVADAFPGKRLRLTASSPGSWGRALEVTVLLIGERFSLILRLPDGTQEVWRDLTARERDERGRPEERLVTAVLGPPARSLLVGVELIDGGAGHPAIPELAALPVPKSARLAGGADGLATLSPEHLSGNGAPAGAAWGLATLANVTEISVVAMPDLMPAPARVLPDPVLRPPDCANVDDRPELIAPPPPDPSDEGRDHPRPFGADEIKQLQLELVGHCERLKNRVAILDARLEDRSPQALVAWRRDFDSSYAAFYHPWLRVADPLGERPGELRAVPPSGHVAGIYARVEAETGAHKPPANELVELARDLSAAVDDVQHGFLNDNRVNVIRAIPGRGLRVAGARTLASDQQWRYVNVRRLLIMLERAIDTRTQWLVFEANNPTLWRAVERVVGSFLDRVWQAGLLEGASAAEAYSVTCDASTNPPAESEQGRLVTLIGVQPPWPAEFVVVRIGKTESGIEIL